MSSDSYVCVSVCLLLYCCVISVLCAAEHWRNKLDIFGQTLLPKELCHSLLHYCWHLPLFPCLLHASARRYWRQRFSIFSNLDDDCKPTIQQQSRKFVKIKKIYFQCMIIPSVDSFKLREKTLLFVTTVFCDIYKWKTTLGALKPTTTATTVKSQNDLLKTRRNGRVFHSWHTASKTHPKRVSKWRMMLMVGGVAVSRYVFMLSSPVLTQFLRRTDSDLQL